MCALCKEQNKPYSFTQIKLQELDYMKHFLPMESRIAKPQGFLALYQFQIENKSLCWISPSW